MRSVNLKDYQHITPQERVNLTIAALAREDFTEADRLTDSCPMHLYRMRDKEFCSRMLALPSIQHLFYEQCVYHYNILIRIDYAALFLEDTDSEHMNEKQPSFDKVHKRYDMLVSRLKAVYQGFMLFCDEVGLDSEAMLKTISVEQSCFSIKKYLESDYEPDQKYTESIKNMLLDCWKI